MDFTSFMWGPVVQHYSLCLPDIQYETGFNIYHYTSVASFSCKFCSNEVTCSLRNAFGVVIVSCAQGYRTCSTVKFFMGTV